MPERSAHARLRTTEGTVEESRPGEVTLRHADGQLSRLSVDEGTRVLVDGRPADADALAPGHEVTARTVGLGRRHVALEIRVVDPTTP